jgi:hypothetical protein
VVNPIKELHTVIVSIGCFPFKPEQAQPQRRQLTPSDTATGSIINIMAMMKRVVCFAVVQGAFRYLLIYSHLVQMNVLGMIGNDDDDSANGSNSRRSHRHNASTSTDS